MNFLKYFYFAFSFCDKGSIDTTDMGGTPHVEGGLNELHNVPVKRRQPKDQKNAILQNNVMEKPPAAIDVDTIESKDKDENLPPGWEKHEGKSFRTVHKPRGQFFCFLYRFVLFT